MRVCIVTPAPARSRKGNRVTALRWARVLRALGHRVEVALAYDGRPCDLLVALHARRSFPAVRRFRTRRPAAPIVVALTGTDLYRDLHTSPAARRSLELATRLVVLQPLARRELPARHRPKVRVIYQSVPKPRRRPRPRRDRFEVCVLGHLRRVKDPLRAPLAARLLPAASRIHVTQVGGALSPAMGARARAEAARNPRYEWLGELPRWQALRVLGRAHLLCLTSVMEGGANAIMEALALGVPIMASRIPGSVGLLGRDYPGYFPVGDTRALAALLWRAETERAFYERLRAHCARRAPIADPARERRTWRDLCAELFRGRRPG